MESKVKVIFHSSKSSKFSGSPWWSSGWDLELPKLGHVQSLARELRPIFHVGGQDIKKKNLILEMDEFLKIKLTV